jgi:CheY-like chemotaxis protein
MHQPLAIVIDDDIMLGALFQAALETCGFKVISISDSSTAFARVLEQMPDLIVLDMQMPKISGLAVAQALRADPRTAHIRIMMVTANAQTTRDEAVNSVVDVLLIKPITLSQIINFAKRLTQGTKPLSG